MNIFYKVIVCVCILVGTHFSAFAQQAVIPDTNLAEAVRTELEDEGIISAGDPITVTALAHADFTSLKARSKGIADLEGLQHATNLTFLELKRNQITNFDPLKHLVNLENLNLGETGFSDDDLYIFRNLNLLEGIQLDNNGITTLPDLSNMNNVNILGMKSNNITDIGGLSDLPNPEKMDTLDFTLNGGIWDLSPLDTGFTNIKTLNLTGNNISDLTPLAGLETLTQLQVGRNNISNIDALSGLKNLISLSFHFNHVRELDALHGAGKFPNLKYLHFEGNNIENLAPLENMTALIHLRAGHYWSSEPHYAGNYIMDFSTITHLTTLTELRLCYNPITLEALSSLTDLPASTHVYLDDRFIGQTILGQDRVTYCQPDPHHPRIRPQRAQDPQTDSESQSDPDPDPDPESAFKRRRYVPTCGVGWAPFLYGAKQPKVMIYALEFEYDPDNHLTPYSCKAIEIRTGDDTIENLAGWTLYLGTRYNPSQNALSIPEADSQVTDRILRITPDMLGLETFPCNTGNGISQPLPGVQYVLKTDENILVDTAYSCFVWGQEAYTTVDGVNVKNQRQISSAALREMETPRLERYILDDASVYRTYMDIEAFTWEREILSDWLLAPSEVSAPGAPSAIRRKLSTTWGALKKL